MIQRRVVFIEAEGGSDKWLDGHRRDTQPIVFALKARGWDSEIIFYRDEWKDRVLEYCGDRFDAYVSRVNPGNLANGESQYFDLLRQLSDNGVIGMAHPDTMVNFGAKDALVKLRHTKLVPEDTYAYYHHGFIGAALFFPIILLWLAILFSAASFFQGVVGETITRWSQNITPIS